MKKPTNQKPERHSATRHPKPNFSAMMNRVREHYLAAGVTEQEFAEIERAAGNPTRAALTIALVMASMEEDGRLRCGGAGV